MDRIENGVERTEDTLRQFAHRLVVIEGMVDAELERLRKDDLRPAGRFNLLRRRWISGVRTARAVSEKELWRIKSAFYDDAPALGGDEVRSE